MFSPLAKKTIFNKSNLAKIFAIVLVCFFIFSGGNVHAGNIAEHWVGRDTFDSGKKVPGEYSTSFTLPGGTSIKDKYVETQTTSGGGTVASFFAVGSDGKTYVMGTSVYQANQSVSSKNNIVTYQYDPESGASYQFNGKTYDTPPLKNVDGDPSKPYTQDYLDALSTATGSKKAGGASDVQQANAAGDKAAKDAAAKGATAEEIAAAKQKAVSDAAGKSQSAPPAPKDTACDLWSNPLCVLARFISYITLKPAALFLWLSGYLFDFVFNLTIVNLSSTLGKTGTAGGFYPVIKEVWGIFRDIINMTFIFVLLYAAINTILRTDTSGMKKTISSVVMAAVLINFSLFFTEVIIDVSNNFAVTIHNQITQMAGGSISAAFAQKLGLQTIMGLGEPNLGNVPGQIIMISIFGSIFLLILAVVFFIVSILFIVRFIMFIILMMMSPVGIGGSVIPKLQEKLGGKFWDDLISQCFFAPVFMLFLWIILKVLNAATSIGGKPLGAFPLDVGITTGGQSILSFVLSFFVIVGLLIKALEVSKSMSASGAEKFQKTALKWGGTAALGTAGFIGRNTVGRAANRVAEKMKERGDLDKTGWRGGLARMSYKASKKTADSSFDVRSSSIGKMVTENAGLDLGKGKDGGYKAQLEEWKKREEAEHKDYTMQTWKEKNKVEDKDKEASNKALLAAEKEINDPDHAEAKRKAEEDEAASVEATVAHNAAQTSATATPAEKRAAKLNKEVAVSQANISKKAFENSSKKMVESLRGLDFKVDSGGLEEFMKKTNKEIAAKKSAGDKQDKDFIKLAEDNEHSTKDMLRTLHEDSKKQLEAFKKSGERRGQSFERQTRLNPFISNGAKTEVRQSMRKTRKEKSPRELLEDALKANNMTPATITTPPPSTP